MKLLVAIPYFYPKIGGLEHYAYKIIEGLINKHKWTVTVVTSSHLTNRYEETNISNIKVIRLPVSFKVSNTPLSLRWYKEIETIVLKEKPNIINGHTPVPYIADIAARIAGKHKIPYVLTYQNDIVKESYLSQFVVNTYYLVLGKRTISLAKKIINTTDFYRTNSIYIRKKRNVTIIPPGIDIPNNKFRKYSKHNTILFVGQLDKTHIHKGLDNLLMSMIEVIKKVDNLKLYIVGSGNDLVRYINKSIKLGIKDYVEFLGNISDYELHKIYSNCEFLVLPSLNNSEGFGMVLLEAAAHKKAVIATNVGGIPFFVDNNNTGIIIEPNNLKQLTESIILLLKNKEMSNTLGSNAYRKVSKEYLWSIQVDKTNQLFKSIL